jgi:hypothetical protein
MKPTWCTIFSVYCISFIYNLYMFRAFPGPSSGGITLQDGFNPFFTPDSSLYRITKYKCCINTVIPPDDGPGEARKM